MKTVMSLQREDALPTRYSLLSRLADWDDHESWKDFFDTYWRLIYSVAIKSGLTETEAQDVVQETVMCVARDLHKFKRDRALGSFKGWLHNIIRWRIADQLNKRILAGRKADRSPLGEGSIPAIEKIPDPGGSELESLWDEEWRKNLFKAAIERVKRRVKEEQYQIFDLVVVKEWPARKVARTLGISLGSVYVAKHRVSALVRAELRSLEKKLF